MRPFRKTSFVPSVENVEQRFMASGDLLLAMGCSTSQPIMDAPPKTQPGTSPAGTPDVLDPQEIMINPYKITPLVAPVTSTTDAYGNPYGSTSYTVAVAVRYNYSSNMA